MKAWRPVTYLLILSLLVYVLKPQIHVLRDSLPLLKQVDLPGLLLAVALTLSSYVFAAQIYRSLAFKPLPLARTVLVQFAGMFVNRLLPGGIGAIGTNFRYLRKQKHTDPQAASVIAVNNVLGIVGNVLLVVLIFCLPHPALHFQVHGVSQKHLFMGLGVVAVVVIGLMFLPKLRVKITRALNGFKTQFLTYRSRPSALAGGLAASMMLTVVNILTLYVCARALGFPVGLLATALIASFGVLVGTATPTPGGLGGIEAALVAGYISVGQSPASSLAIVLLYRLVSYWFVLVLSSGAFLIVVRRKYI